MNKLKITRYSSESGVLNPKKLLSDLFSDLKKSYGIAIQLTKRDISAQYRQSFLGYFWAFAVPLVNSIIWIFLQNTGIVKMANTGIPYPVYVFSGTLLWQIFTESITSPIQQITAAKGLLSKLNFPREALLLSGVLKVLFNTLIKLIILIPVLFIYKIIPDWKIILFPFSILSLVVVGLSVGLLVTPVAMLYNDIVRVIPMAMQALMYFSPVVFLMPSSGVSYYIFKYNFITPLLLTARDFLTGGEPIWINYFCLVNVVAIVILVLVLVVFRITMPVLIERMNA